MAEREQVRRCPSGHECPTLPRIFRALRLREADVLNVYIVGSHMWGSCTRKSDWDFVIVAKQLDSSKPINAHKGIIEAFILSKEQFIHFLKDHSVQVLQTLWLARKFVLREMCDGKALFKLDRTALVESLQKLRERDFRVAEKHFRKGDRERVWKTLLHCLRSLELGAQVGEEGRVREYGGAERHREAILGGLRRSREEGREMSGEEGEEWSWEEVREKVERIVDSVWARVTQDGIIDTPR